ncbi:MAG: hypothetical protein JNJ98_00625 [Gemmatimonadetes bacterium]|nr:hypothetical protein [Gemmatimonadota bacterium]
MTIPRLAAVVVLLLVPAGGVLAQAAAPARPWVPSRTSHGHPDLQGNWTNATLTPLERPAGLPLVLSAAQVAMLEKVRTDSIDKLSQKSDPNRTAPPVGGDGSTGAAGMVGGYNYFWIDAGDHIMVVNGEARGSIITYPANGRVPALTAGARSRQMERARRFAGMGQYDNPENRPLAERCIMSFGSNAGPPMLPNYFYNNNYTIVQTKDHVMIMTEMVHDARIIHLGAPPAEPSTQRPWMGLSYGRWVGDTLVVETTNFHPDQTFRGASEHLKVTERLVRVGERALNYRFHVEDSTTFSAPWGGELPFLKMDEQIYEYACHEGNYALSNVLSGARAQERDAARRKPAPARKPNPKEE